MGDSPKPPDQVLRDYANCLIASDNPDAATWAEALTWAADRIRGGQLSIQAAWDFGIRFHVNPYPGAPPKPN